MAANDKKQNEEIIHQGTQALRHKGSEEMRYSQLRMRRSQEEMRRFQLKMRHFVGHPSGYYARGCMDDFRIYSRALREEEMLALYNLRG
jgi:hypothetical protein